MTASACTVVANVNDGVRTQGTGSTALTRSNNTFYNNANDGVFTGTLPAK